MQSIRESVSESSFLEILAESMHVEEILRVVSLLADKKLRYSTLRTRVLQTAARNFRYPPFDAALRAAVMLGLIERSTDLVSLTVIGTRFVSLGDESAGLTLDQKEFLFRLLSDSAEFEAASSELLRLSSRQGSDLFLDTKLLPAKPTLLIASRFLQQLDIVDAVGSGIRVNASRQLQIAAIFPHKSSISEEALWKILNSQREQGLRAEEIVVRKERQRLESGGRSDLAEDVTRVSKFNVAAGYDILSFELDGSARYIEVKSSLGIFVRFHWSNSERNAARECGNSYWIYFLPLFEMPRSAGQVLAIQNPIEKIASGMFEETNYLEYFVEEASNFNRDTFAV